MLFIFFLSLVVGFFLAPLKMLFGGWLVYTIPEVLTVLLILKCWGDRKLQGNTIFPITPITRPFLLFAGYCLLQVLNPESPLFRSLLGFRSLLLYTTLFFAGFHSFHQEKQISWIYGMLILLGVVTGLFGVWQWNAGPAVIATWGGRYAEYAAVMRWNLQSGKLVFRAFSTFVLPGTFGSNMAFVMLITLAYILASGEARGWRAIVNFAALGTMGMGLFVSGSRSPLVELIGGSLIMFWLRGKIASGLKGSFFIVVGLWLALSSLGVFFLERFQTLLKADTFFWQWFGNLMSGLQIALSNPLGLGLGYTGGVPRFVDKSWVEGLSTGSIDSGIGAIAAELGIPGLVLYLYVLFKLATSSIQAWRALPPGRLKNLLLAPAAFGIMSLLLSPLSNVLRASLPFSMYYWFLIGILMKASEIQRLQRADRLLRPQVYSRK